MSTLLHYPYEVRDEREHFDEIQNGKATKRHDDLFSEFTFVHYRVGLLCGRSPKPSGLADVENV
jgi:hypothetical protein